MAKVDMDDDSAPKTREKDYSGVIAGVILVGLLAMGIFYGEFQQRNQFAGERQSAALQTTRTIGLAMFAYASDHDGKYPTGKSSTEVFQSLIDEKYISDPSIFYNSNMPHPGKVKATTNHLKAENVCYDVTIEVDQTAPDDLPLVFTTGYKVNYVPGAAAPRFTLSSYREGACVAYKSNSTRFIEDDGPPDHVIRNFVPPTFNAGGKTYRQLTPDGPLPP